MPSHVIAFQHTEVYNKMSDRAVSPELEIISALFTYAIRLWKSRNWTRREILVRKEVYINSEGKDTTT